MIEMKGSGESYCLFYYFNLNEKSGILILTALYHFLLTHFCIKQL